METGPRWTTAATGRSVSRCHRPIGPMRFPRRRWPHCLRCRARGGCRSRARRRIASPALSMLARSSVPQMSSPPRPSTRATNWRRHMGTHQRHADDNSPHPRWVRTWASGSVGSLVVSVGSVKAHGRPSRGTQERRVDDENPLGWLACRSCCLGKEPVDIASTTTTPTPGSSSEPVGSVGSLHMRVGSVMPRSPTHRVSHASAASNAPCDQRVCKMGCRATVTSSSVNVRGRLQYAWPTLAGGPTSGWEPTDDNPHPRGVNEATRFRVLYGAQWKRLWCADGAVRRSAADDACIRDVTCAFTGVMLRVGLAETDIAPPWRGR